MADGVSGAVLVNIGLEFSGRDLEILGKEGAQIEAAVAGTRQQIGAIAGGDYLGLFHIRELSQPRDSVRQANFRNGKPLANLQGSAAMVDADEMEDHWPVQFPTGRDAGSSSRNSNRLSLGIESLSPFLEAAIAVPPAAPARTPIPAPFPPPASPPMSAPSPAPPTTSLAVFEPSPLPLIS